jgi:hypothetical protein
MSSSNDQEKDIKNIVKAKKLLSLTKRKIVLKLSIMLMQVPMN